MTTGHEDFQDSAYRGLADAHDDVSRWAFGTAFENGIDDVAATIAGDVDTADVAAYCLMLGDDALVMSHRLSQWCSNAPDLEEDIALANFSLDLLGQARILLARAAVADPACVPELPAQSPVPDEDALAFFRDDDQYRNVRLVELDNGDFAETITRLMVFSTWRFRILTSLECSRDPVLQAVAAKGVKEIAYHRDFAARWFVTLAQGTPYSLQRIEAGMEYVWPFRAELVMPHAVEQRVAEAGVGVDPDSIAADVDEAVERIVSLSPVSAPEVLANRGLAGRCGRDGVHTEALSPLLAQMQSVARAHPLGRW